MLRCGRLSDGVRGKRNCLRQTGERRRVPLRASLDLVVVAVVGFAIPVLEHVLALV